MNQAEYWHERFQLLESAAHEQSDAYLAELERLYHHTEISVRREIESWYQRFAVNNGISLSEARKQLTTGQLAEFKWTVEQYIKIGQQENLSKEWMHKLENASARFHVSRLEAIQMQIQQQIELLYRNQVDGIDALLRELISNGYTSGAFEIQKGFAIGWDFISLDQTKLAALLAKPWTTDGRTFQDRCWTNKVALVDTVHKALIQGMLRGDAPEKTIRTIQKQFGAERYKARRLVHTEISYFNAVSKKQMYAELGVDKIEIVETLDSRTCPICQPLDGMVLPLIQYEPGVTVPPFHPNCRGTTCPYFDDMEGERAARSESGNVYYVPADMTFTQWKKAFVDGVKDGLTAATTGSIMKAHTKKDRGTAVQTVGKIDIEKYRCITDDITTDEVIITDTQIKHIMDRHPGDYERFCGYFSDIISDPDYILEANRPYTAFILKRIQSGNENFQMILRLKTSQEPEGYKNSIITFLKIDQRKWDKYLRNKKILYRRE